jgi:phosphoribosylaminoimidazolecarboxamide formyltransferase/IMP cyclohydrolase
MLKIRRALISVWDKKGLIEFTKRLRNLNIEIISTGKTASLLRRSGIEVKTVSSITSFPEFLSGRVKTLHPRIFGGILANKKHPLHMEELRSLKIEPIDMIVVNFYPFKRMLKEKIGFDQMLEYIDIGGPAMLRAGAKNFKNVACISAPSQYKRVIEELERNRGMLGEETLKGLACEVFRVVKDYDTYIYSFLKGKETLIWDLEKVSCLRYGENPHQKASLCKLLGTNDFEFNQLQGKPLSFNNLLDLDVAFSLVRDFSEPAVVIVKHASPCGVSCGKKLHLVFARAYKSDPISSFGGIIGLNRKVDGESAREIIKSGFKECIIAPAYSKEATKLFSSKKNLRVIEANFGKVPDYKDVRKTTFGYLIQDNDLPSLDKGELRVVTKKRPTDRAFRDLIFAWKVVKFVKSNAIVVAKDNTTLGIGGGQPSRVGAVKLAIKNSLRSTKKAVLASDGFFPNPDSIKVMKRYGVEAVIQPGGSIRDSEIIELCDKFGISMIFTGIRHFRH